jgi:GntR family transcriptional regulator
MTVLDRDDPEPLYRRLMTDLLEQMASGTLQPGQKLASTRQLEKIYGVSSIVVRRALVELQRQGKVVSVPGKGTYVAQHTIDLTLQVPMGFAESMRRQGFHPSSIVLRAELVPAQGKVARMLAVPSGTEIAVLERVRLGDGIPMCVQTSFLLHSLCPEILKHDFRALSLYQVLREKYRIAFGWCTHHIRARRAEQREARLLELPASVALLCIDTCSYTTTEQVFEYGETAYRGDRYELYSSAVHLPTDLQVQA